MDTTPAYQCGRHVVDVPEDLVLDGRSCDRIAEDISTSIVRELIAVHANTTVNHYHGDFVRDAFFLRRYVYRALKQRAHSRSLWERRLYWAADDCGTFIGEELQYAVESRGELALYTLDLRFGLDKWQRHVVTCVIHRAMLVSTETVPR